MGILVCEGIFWEGTGLLSLVPCFIRAKVSKRMYIHMHLFLQPVLKNKRCPSLDWQCKHPKVCAYFYLLLRLLKKLYFCSYDLSVATKGIYLAKLSFTSFTVEGGGGQPLGWVCRQGCLHLTPVALRGWESEALVWLLLQGSWCSICFNDMRGI